MFKRTVTIKIFECDHVDEYGIRCTNEGERNAIKKCAMCKKDLCSKHYETISVLYKGRTVLTYFFCPKHANDFIDTVVQVFGDTGPIEAPGFP